MSRHSRKFLVAVLVATGVTAQAQVAEIVLHSFGGPLLGTAPSAGVIRDSSGNLYGTTTRSGATGEGVLYKQDQAGNTTVLYTFSGGADGGVPTGDLASDSAGNIYGTTLNGGAGYGVAYRLAPNGQETVIYTFTGGSDGAYPNGGLIRDGAGNLYGTTLEGGTTTGPCSSYPYGPLGCGVVFKLDPSGHEMVLHTFTGNEDGGNTSAGLFADHSGNLYGTVIIGGITNSFCAYGCGFVYRLSASGNYSVLHKFDGGLGGGVPMSPVIRDAAGNLYGTTAISNPGYGVVYRLSAQGRKTVLHTFAGTDGSAPLARLTRDSSGNLYGSTSNGGPRGGYSGYGVIFKVGAAGDYTTLYSFAAGADGAYPVGSLVLNPSGSVLGVNQNVIYEVQANGQLRVLYSFTQDGAFPIAGVLLKGGSIYGTTFRGGAANAGVVYRMEASGRTTIFYTFNGFSGDLQPWGGVIADNAGNLYGTTFGNQGEIYELNATGQETVLFTGQGTGGGTAATAGLIRDPAGNLYGTMSGGGTTGNGVVYKLDPAGHETVLHNFSGRRDGGTPMAGLIRDSAGHLYGTTWQGGSCCGVVYEVDPSGHEKVIYTFTGGVDGGYPAGGLMRDAGGNLYGTTTSGGGAGRGVVYKVDTSGHETVLHTFTGGTDGANPQSALIPDSAGNLYGTTACGGTGATGGGGGFACGTGNGAGVVFRLDASGNETILYTFTGGADGAMPQAGLTPDQSGNLYGTTYAGGVFNAGVVFKLPNAATPVRE